LVKKEKKKNDTTKLQLEHECSACAQRSVYDFVGKQPAKHRIKNTIKNENKDLILTTNCL